VRISVRSTLSNGDDVTRLSRNLATLSEQGVVLPETTTAGPTVRLEDGPADAVLSLCTADGRWIRMHSRHVPEQEADRLIAPAFESGDPAVLIVIGLGLGYVLDAIERRSSRTRVLALEPAPASLRHMLSRRDWSAWLTANRLRLLVGPDYPGASDAWKSFEADASLPPIIIHPVLAREARADVIHARQVVERIAFGALANLEARKQFAGRYLLNTLKNLPVIAREGNAGALFDAFTGVPAIVASAGPSLDRNIPAIQAFRGRALLIAVDTALRPLLGAGIDPQVVVAVDPSEANGRHLTNLPDAGRTWLVAEGSMDPVVFEPFYGRTFIFNVSDHHPWPWLRGLGLDRDRLRAWGSVATSAFDLALKMGCDPIIFAGQDLAYTGGRPYCRGTTLEEIWAARAWAGEELADVWAQWIGQAGAQTVDDNSGGKVVTMPSMIAFRDWIAEQTVGLVGRTVINATGGGILRGVGICQADLGTVLASLPPFPELDARVRDRWSRTWTDLSTATKGTKPPLLEAFTRASRGEELATWASFANTTPDTLAADLEGVATFVKGQFADAAPRPTASATAAHPHRGTPTYSPELARATRALLLDEPIPEWARFAVPAIDVDDPLALRQLFDRLPPPALLALAEHCEAAAAYAHAAELFARLADRWKQDQNTAQARAAALNRVRSLVCAGDFEAAQTLIRGERLLPDQLAVQHLASIYQMTGDHEKIDGLVATFPDTPGLRLNLAVTLALKGNLRDALTQVDVDARRWPGRVIPSFMRGVCLRLHGDYDAATKHQAAIVDEWPHAAPELIVASVAARQPEATERALRACDRAFERAAAFVMAPPGQTAFVDEAVRRLGAELAATHRHVEVRRLSPFGVVLVVQPADAWKPRWQP
jgi:hypothetical protein